MATVLDLESAVKAPLANASRSIWSSLSLWNTVIQGALLIAVLAILGIQIEYVRDHNRDEADKKELGEIRKHLEQMDEFDHRSRESVPSELVSPANFTVGDGVPQARPMKPEPSHFVEKKRALAMRANAIRAAHPEWGTSEDFGSR